MKGGCVIGDGHQRDIGLYILCMKGERPGVCLHKWVRTQVKKLASANGAVGSWSTHSVLSARAALPRLFCFGVGPLASDRTDIGCEPKSLCLCMSSRIIQHHLFAHMII